MKRVRKKLFSNIINTFGVHIFIAAARLVVSIGFILCVAPAVWAFDPCDIDALFDESGSFSIREKRVGPGDLILCRRCPALLAFNTWGDIEKARPMDAFSEMIMRDAMNFKGEANARLLFLWKQTGRSLVDISQTVSYEARNKERLHQATVAAMAAGQYLIKNPFLMTDTRFAAPDYLVRVEARGPPRSSMDQSPLFQDLDVLSVMHGPPSRFGNYFYVPIVIKSGSAKELAIAFEAEGLTHRYLDSSADYKVIMLHTISVLQDIQYSAAVRGVVDGALDNSALFQPQGLFVLKNYSAARTAPDDPAQFQFAYFSMLMWESMPEALRARLNKSFSPSFRTLYRAMLEAQAVKARVELSETPLHFGSQCKTCVWTDAHAERMREVDHVSLIYRMPRGAAEQFVNMPGPSGRPLDNWRAVAELNPDQAIALFPELSGVGAKNVIPELHRYILQARVLGDQAPVDNMPIMDFPPQLIRMLNAVGIFSYRQVAALVDANRFDALVTMLTGRQLTSENLADAKKELTRVKTAMTRELKKQGGEKFGHIWSYEEIRRSIAAANQSVEDVMSLMAAIERTEFDYRAAPETMRAELHRLRAWVARVRGHRYFDLLPLQTVESRMVTPEVAIYFDIEGYPGLHIKGADGQSLSAEYAWGLRVVNRARHRMIEERVLVLRDYSMDGLRNIWHEFLDIAGRHRHAKIYYFSDYEMTVVDRFISMFGTLESAGQDLSIRGRMVDLRQVLATVLTMPTYAYDLKTVAKWAGFTWRDSEASAVQSMVWFRTYLETGDASLLERIKAYNLDDVRATEVLHRFFYTRNRDAYLNQVLNGDDPNYLRNLFKRIGRDFNKRFK